MTAVMRKCYMCGQTVEVLVRGTASASVDRPLRRHTCGHGNWCRRSLTVQRSTVVLDVECEQCRSAAGETVLNDPGQGG